MSTPDHVLRVTHDPASHAEGCHDDCTALLVCPGVTNACRTWWECDRCRKVVKRLDNDAAEEAYDVRVEERGEAHGVEHQRIDGMWMTPSDQCLSDTMEHDGYSVAFDYGVSLLEGDHPVDLEWDEYLYVLLPTTRSWRVNPPADSPLWYERDDIDRYRHRYHARICCTHPVTGTHHQIHRYSTYVYVRPCPVPESEHTEENRA